MKKSLIASKSMKYGTRRLMAGDTFEASRAEAKLLVALGRATMAPDERVADAEVAPAPKKLPKGNLSAAREKAKSVGLGETRVKSEVKAATITKEASVPDPLFPDDDDAGQPVPSPVGSEPADPRAPKEPAGKPVGVVQIATEPSEAEEKAKAKAKAEAPDSVPATPSGKAPVAKP